MPHFAFQKPRTTKPDQSLNLKSQDYKVEEGLHVKTSLYFSFRMKQQPVCLVVEEEGYWKQRIFSMIIVQFLLIFVTLISSSPVVHSPSFGSGGFDFGDNYCLLPPELGQGSAVFLEECETLGK